MSRALLSALLPEVLLLLPGLAASATLVRTETRIAGREPARVQRADLVVDGQRMRVDSGGTGSSVIYDATRQTAWLLDHREKTFVKVDRGTTRKVAEKIDQASQALAKSLEGLPPQQRKAMERLLGQVRPAPPAEPEIRTVATDRRDQVNGIACREVEVRRGDERMAVVCRADFADAGVSAESFAVMRELASFLRESAAAMIPGGLEKLRHQGLSALQSLEALDGLPLRVRAYEKGRLATETLVTGIGPASAEEGRFRVPADYQGGFSLRDFELPAAPR